MNTFPCKWEATRVRHVLMRMCNTYEARMSWVRLAPGTVYVNDPLYVEYSLHN